MWVFDGEEWTQEGVSREPAKPEASMPRLDEFQPELQIIEIVPVRQPDRYIPVPLP